MKNLLLISFMVLGINTYAQELQYPELNVTPRASERIKLELRDEKSNLNASLLPIQLSALSTLIASGMSSSSIKEDKESEGGDKAPLLAMGVGLGWIGASVWASMSYKPYKDAFIKLRKLPKGSLRERLTLERLAEERINELRSMGKKIRYLSVFTNLAAAGALLENVEPETDANIMAATSALMAFVPLFFKTHWEKVGDEQEKYKKKIFSPVAVAPIMVDPFTQKKAAGFTALFKF